MKISSIIDVMVSNYFKTGDLFVAFLKKHLSKHSTLTCIQFRTFLLFVYFLYIINQFKSKISESDKLQ